MTPSQNGLLIMIFRKKPSVMLDYSHVKFIYSMNSKQFRNFKIIQGHSRSIRVKYIKNVMHYFDMVYLTILFNQMVLWWFITEVLTLRWKWVILSLILNKMLIARFSFNHKSQCITRPMSISIVLSDLMVWKLNF